MAERKESPIVLVFMFASCALMLVGGAMIFYGVVLNEGIWGIRGFTVGIIGVPTFVAATIIDQRISSAQIKAEAKRAHRGKA